MGQPVARKGDSVLGADTHIVLVPSGTGTVPSSLPGHVFSGTITDSTSSDVKADGMEVATVDSVAQNSSPHLPMPPGVSFQSPPSNKGKVTQGSATVTASGKAVARVGDSVETCNDPKDAPTSAITSGSGTVMVG